ncbi:MAG TPA: hypothetical protein VJ023_12485 [Pyrinomonadaceae bacterium]|nr:hypothetical protein [Pyrinomonadaceae bacterium]
MDPMPEGLKRELRLMRRNPAEFTVLRKGRCKCRMKNAFDLGHPVPLNAGSWCLIHGWLFFDSVKIRPTGEEYAPRKRKLGAA